MRYFFFVILVLIFLAGCKLQSPPVNPVSTKKAAEEKIFTHSLEAEVPILIYHQIRPVTSKDSTSSKEFILEPTEFEKQMKYLDENGFATITIERLASYLTSSTTPALPEKPLAIVFDDGTIGQYENGFPILEKYGMVGTFYIFTNPAGKSKNYINWQQLKEMSEAGMEIGSHTVYHLRIYKMDHPADLRREIFDSKKIIEEKLEKKVNSFNYPFGVWTPDLENLVRQAGYKSARGITNGKLHSPDDLFNLRAYFVTDNFSRFVNIVN